MIESRTDYLEYYRPLVGMNVVGVAEANDAEWPALVVSHPEDPEHEFELDVSQDPEGNGPGFLFFATGDESKGVIELEDLTITAVALLRDEYEDWLYWPTLICAREGKTPLTITISQDPEGNGPGHLLGVPQDLEIS